MKKIALVLSLVLLLPVWGMAKSLKTPEVWMSILPADGLTADGAKWDFVKKHLDGVKIWTWHIIQGDKGYTPKDWPFHNNATATDSLKQLIKVLNENKISLIVEKNNFPPIKPDYLSELLGGKAGPYDDTFCKRAVDSSIEHMRFIESLGGKVKFFDLDGGMRQLLLPYQGGKGFATPEEATDELCKYMLGVKKVYPQIGFFELSNFPNWGYKGDNESWQGPGVSWGDYYDSMVALIKAAKRTHAPLKGITVDNPYDYIIGEVKVEGSTFDPKKVDWIGRVLDVEKYTRKNGLEFNLIFNSQRGGSTSMETFCKETLDYIDLYIKHGGRPDRYIIQSWYTHPTYDEVVPETKPYTFTWLVKEVIRRVKVDKVTTL